MASRQPTNTTPVAAKICTAAATSPLATPDTSYAAALTGNPSKDKGKAIVSKSVLKKTSQKPPQVGQQKKDGANTSRAPSQILDFLGGIDRSKLIAVFRSCLTHCVTATMI